MSPGRVLFFACVCSCVSRVETPDAGGPPLKFSSLAAHIHTCGIATDGKAWCWGQNNFGQVGDGTTEPRERPTRVAQDRVFSELSLSRSSHVCGLSGETVYCWGAGARGQLGDGTSTSHDEPTPVAGAYSSVSTRLHTSCAVSATGAASCWGENGSGQFGDGTTTSRDAPSPAGGTLAFKQVSIGDLHGCGLQASDGLAYCWGSNDIYGRLGDGTQMPRLSPTPVAGGRAYASVHAGATHTCALTGAGEAFCWGDNSSGQLGDGTTTTRMTPTPVMGLLFSELTVSPTGAFTCGVAMGGDTYCWGQNDDGALGDGTTTDRHLPTLVMGRFTRLTAGAAHTCGIAPDGTAWCWGEGSLDRLGNADGGGDSHVPLPVVGP